MSARLSQLDAGAWEAIRSAHPDTSPPLPTSLAHSVGSISFAGTGEWGNCSNTRPRVQARCHCYRYDTHIEGPVAAAAFVAASEVSHPAAAPRPLGHELERTSSLARHLPASMTSFVW